MEQEEEKVWQRVFSQNVPGRLDLRPLLLGALESAAAFRFLERQWRGQPREQAAGLYLAQMETAACLRGLELLSGEGREPPKGLPQAKGPGRKLLERAFFQARQAMGEYTARSLDRDFGSVFRYLAQQEERRCVEIARLLGTL